MSSISITVYGTLFTYTVIVSVDNSEGLVIPGMSANVSIVTNKVENALCVPNRALKFTPATETKKYEKQGVWVKSGTGMKRCEVELGASDENYTQILTDEVKVGDKVYVGSNQMQKKGGMSGMKHPRM